jgi:Tol biopolymer transport system component
MTLDRIPKLFFAGIAVFLLSASYIAAQRGVDPETRFRDAQRKQELEGDLNAAITIYREIVASPNASHALKARALLQLATSLETLGEQAEGVYQRIVSEYADQPTAVSQARQRLAVLKPAGPPALTLTQIRFGAGVQNVVATDGQRAVYWDADRTTLFIGDKDGKSRTQIFKTSTQRRPRAEVSRDLSLVFLYFLPTEQKPISSYAVIRTDGSGTYREVDLTDAQFSASLPLYGVSWSFDNRYVVLCKMVEDRVVRPLKLTIDDGQVVELLPGHPLSMGYAVVSPDGHSIAMTGLVGNVNGAVYIKSLQGSDIETVADVGAVADWTLDSRNLVFAAQDGQGSAMYTIPVRDGHIAGKRILVQGGLSFALNEMSKPTTSANSLIFAAGSRNRGGAQVYYSSLDDEGRLKSWTKMKTAVGQGGFPTYPVFSPDGTTIAYRVGPVFRATGGRGSSVRLYTIATGSDKELFLNDGPIMTCLWAYRTPALYCGQPLLNEQKTAILSIDTTSGRSETLASFPGIRTMESLSLDGRTIRMYNLSGPTNWPRWEIGAKEENPGPTNAPYTTPDERWAFRLGEDKTSGRTYEVRPISAGEDAWERLISFRKQSADARDVIPLKATADGNWLVYNDLDANGMNALFRVRITGGEPERLGDYPISSPNSYLNVSLDGRQFVVETSSIDPTIAEGLQTDYWILENFVPATNRPPSKP